MVGLLFEKKKLNKNYPFKDFFGHAAHFSQKKVPFKIRNVTLKQSKR
jgi:hypothetical protein